MEFTKHNERKSSQVLFLALIFVVSVIASSGVAEAQIKLPLGQHCSVISKDLVSGIKKSWKNGTLREIIEKAQNIAQTIREKANQVVGYAKYVKSNNRKWNELTATQEGNIILGKLDEKPYNFFSGILD